MLQRLSLDYSAWEIHSEVSMADWKQAPTSTYFSELNPDQKNAKVNPASWIHNQPWVRYRPTQQLMPLQLCVHRCVFMVCIKYGVRSTNMSYIEIPDLLLWPKGVKTSSWPPLHSSTSHRKSSLWCCAALSWSQLCLLPEMCKIWSYYKCIVQVLIHNLNVYLVAVYSDPHNTWGRIKPSGWIVKLWS